MFLTRSQTAWREWFEKHANRWTGGVTSAFVKLCLHEEESDALRAHLGGRPLISSVLLHVEAVRCAGPPMGKVMARSSGAISLIRWSSGGPAGLLLDEAQLAETLVSLEGEGLVTRTDGEDRTQAWRWAAASAGAEESKPASAGASDAATPRQRHRPGELRARVLEPAG